MPLAPALTHRKFFSILIFYLHVLQPQNPMAALHNPSSKDSY